MSAQQNHTMPSVRNCCGRQRRRRIVVLVALDQPSIWFNALIVADNKANVITANVRILSQNAISFFSLIRNSEIATEVVSLSPPSQGLRNAVATMDVPCAFISLGTVPLKRHLKEGNFQFQCTPIDLQYTMGRIRP